MRIPAFLLLSILVVNSLFFPGASDKLVGLGPISITREGVTFGLISAGRILVAFLASIALLFTTLADDALEALIAQGELVGDEISGLLESVGLREVTAADPYPPDLPMVPDVRAPIAVVSEPA